MYDNPQNMFSVKNLPLKEYITEHIKMDCFTVSFHFFKHIENTWI